MKGWYQYKRTICPGCIKELSLLCAILPLHLGTMCAIICTSVLCPMCATVAYVPLVCPMCATLCHMCATVPPCIMVSNSPLPHVCHPPPVFCVYPTYVHRLMPVMDPAPQSLDILSHITVVVGVEYQENVVGDCKTNPKF